MYFRSAAVQRSSLGSGIEFRLAKFLGVRYFEYRLFTAGGLENGKAVVRLPYLYKSIHPIVEKSDRWASTGPSRPILST